MRKLMAHNVFLLQQKAHQMMHTYIFLNGVQQGELLCFKFSFILPSFCLQLVLRFSQLNSHIGSTDMHINKLNTKFKYTTYKNETCITMVPPSKCINPKIAKLALSYSLKSTYIGVFLSLINSWHKLSLVLYTEHWMHLSRDRSSRNCPSKFWRSFSRLSLCANLKFACSFSISSWICCCTFLHAQITVH